MLTKKHFIALADIVRRLPADDETKRWLGDELGQFCADSNPGFNWGRWESYWRFGLVRERYDTAERQV